MKSKIDYLLLATSILLLGVFVNISMADVPARFINNDPVFDWTNGNQGGGEVSGGPPGTDESGGGAAGAAGAGAAGAGAS